MGPLKYFICFLFATTITNSFAQFTKVKIGVNGMTCSACTRSVEVSLKRLVFVESVEMDLEQTNGILTFKDKMIVDVAAISRAVTEAGFSVRYLEADYIFEGKPDSKIIKDRNYEFYFLKELPAEREVHMIFKGKEYQTRKDFLNTKAQFPEVDFGTGNFFVLLSVPQ